MKSKLQFDIDNSIESSKDWGKFIKIMAAKGYEIKHGKHIAFKTKTKKDLHVLRPLEKTIQKKKLKKEY